MRAAGLLELFMALASGYEVEVWEDLSSHILRCAECRDAFGFLPSFPWAPLVAQMVKNLLAMQETHVRSLDRDDPWRRAWQPTPVFLPGGSHGQRSLVSYSPWGHKELDMTEQLTCPLFTFLLPPGTCSGSRD